MASQRRDPTEAPLLTSDVARLLDVSPERVRQLAREGHLEAIRAGHGVRLYDRGSVERLIRTRQCRNDRASAYFVAFRERFGQTTQLAARRTA